ncbi:hypothetical protein [Urechidicola vernalis]|uniref:DUF4369 domain-containing protein n=1 Tax=Urechidicola vernalis TaxID=3075600 RepID=A0ABU2Y4G0_9FLAO|nr:hypothetical protein [Urechidicola sp. P050]MDT0552160.1 hypothetical protein [Urechidicola sp. P050]
MTKQLTTLLLLFCVTINYAQERIPKQGKVLHFKLPINGAHVLNLTTREGTSTLADGSFTISLRLNDTIQVSHLNYHTKRFVFSERHRSMEIWSVFLDELTNELDTVEIKSHDLTGMISTDSKTVGRVLNKDSIAQMYRDLAYQKSNKSFGRDLEKPPLVIVDPTGGPSVGGAVGVPFRFKDLELRRNLKSKTDFPTKLISELSLVYFTKTLKIPEDKVHHFITYCQFKNIKALYDRNDIIKLIEILEQESTEYLKIKD